MEKIYKTCSIKDLIPYENNPRINADAVKYVAESIKQCEYISPIVVDENMVVLAGHTRLRALKKLKRKQCEILQIIGMNEEQKKKYRLLDNKTGEFADWDFDLLEEELEGLDFGDLDIDWGIDDIGEDEEERQGEYSEDVKQSLQERFGVPPFTILDTRQGYWQERKRNWKELNLKSEQGRGENLIGFDAMQKQAGIMEENTGTSIFDPVLCEIMYKWFNVDGGTIYDCFAGGCVRGVVAELLGYKYFGIDLRSEQIEDNKKKAEQINVNPTYFCDDSQNADKYIDDESCDMIFSCPPYFDLEVYSDDPKDISNMNYEDFSKIYQNIISVACRKLKKDRFAVFVVGDIRDKKGFYRDFIGLTKQCFYNSGLKLYNELILVEPLGTAPFRAKKYFLSSRKVVKTHQNVLVFYKGDAKQIKNNFGEVFMDNVEED